MSNLEYYSRIELFGKERWKESLSDYLDRYHAWMVSNGFYHLK